MAGTRSLQCGKDVLRRKILVHDHGEIATDDRLFRDRPRCR
jgi:hypothetical protein